jgi:hypothetical protein
MTATVPGGATRFRRDGTVKHLLAQDNACQCGVVRIFLTAIQCGISVRGKRRPVVPIRSRTVLCEKSCGLGYGSTPNSVGPNAIRETSGTISAIPARQLATLAFNIRLDN